MDGRDLCLGIDVGGTKVSAALFTDSGEISHREKVPLDTTGPDESAGQIAALIAEYEEAGHAPRAIGIAIPGVVFHDSGEV